jgi:hypothetical protein
MNGFGENMAWKLWMNGMKNRALINLAPSSIKNVVFSKVFSKSWSKRRTEIVFAKENFSQLWKAYKNEA